MLLIDQGGKRIRKVCDRCHCAGGTFRRGEVCEACALKQRRQTKREADHRWFMNAIASAKRAVGQ